jgi:hypothetical protein
MTDIVERLRIAAKKIVADGVVMYEAAREIERLRAALSTIANTRVSSWIGDIHGDTQDEWRDGLDQAISIARAALAKEKTND